MAKDKKKVAEAIPTTNSDLLEKGILHSKDSIEAVAKRQDKSEEAAE